MFNRYNNAVPRAHVAGLLITLLVLPLAGWSADTSPAEPVARAAEITMYKGPACGCCGLWAEHLRLNGFTVHEVATNELMAIKERYGVPQQVYSCHTAVIGGYAIEGHVPASAIRRLLDEQPALAGIAVGGMVRGSPGMEGPNPMTYQIQAFDKAGKLSVYATEQGQAVPQ